MKKALTKDGLHATLREVGNRLPEKVNAFLFGGGGDGVPQPEAGNQGR